MCSEELIPVVEHLGGEGASGRTKAVPAEMAELRGSVVGVFTWVGLPW